MQRWLSDKLTSQNIKVSRVDPGIYSHDYIDNLNLYDNDRQELIDNLIDPKLVSKIMSQIVISDEYNPEINIYKELRNEKWAGFVQDLEYVPTEPPIYTQIR